MFHEHKNNKLNHFSPISRHPYEMKTTLWSSALSCCGWPASSFDHCLHERTTKNITWNSMTSSLLGCCLLSWTILLIASTKHLKCPLDHHFHVSLPNTALGLPTSRAASPSHREKWPLSKEPFLTLTWIAFDWLIQVMDLIWWVTMNPSLSPFLSTKWSPIVTRT